MIKSWFQSGAPWVWLNAAAVSTSIILVFGLLVLIAVRGSGHFWPANLYQYEYTASDGFTHTIVGEVAGEEEVSAARLKEAGITTDFNTPTITRVLVKTGNRDITGLDFRWLVEPNISDKTLPQSLVAVERREWGNFYGKPSGPSAANTTVGLCSRCTRRPATSPITPACQPWSWRTREWE